MDELKDEIDSKSSYKAQIKKDLVTFKDIIPKLAKSIETTKLDSMEALKE